MAQLEEQTSSQTGTKFIFTEAFISGDTFVNNGSHKLLVKNDSGGEITITFISANTCNFGAADIRAHDRVDVIPANEIRFFRDFDPLRFNDLQSRVSMTYSDVTGLSLACFV